MKRDKGCVTYLGGWVCLQLVCRARLGKELRMFCVDDLPWKYSFEFIEYVPHYIVSNLKIFLRYNSTGGKKFVLYRNYRECSEAHFS